MWKLVVIFVGLLPSILLTMGLPLTITYLMMFLVHSFPALKSLFLNQKNKLLTWEWRKTDYIAFFLISSIITGLLIVNYLVFEAPFLLRSSEDGYTPLELIEVLIVGVIAEEAYFRSFLWEVISKNSRKNKSNWVACLFISSLLFGLHHLGYWGWKLHQQSLQQVGGTAACGIIFGVIRLSSGNLRWSIWAHQLFNCIGITFWSLTR